MTQPLQAAGPGPDAGNSGSDEPAAGADVFDDRATSVGWGSDAAAEAGAVAEPVLAGGGAAGGLGAAAAGGGGGLGGFSGAGLTSYTRPTSSFEPEAGGRPGSLRAGVLNAAEVRGPTASTGMGGSPMPMSPAGMLARGSGRRYRQGRRDARARRRWRRPDGLGVVPSAEIDVSARLTRAFPR